MTDNFQTLLDEYATVAAHVDAEQKKVDDIKKIRDRIKEAVLAQMNQIGIKSAKSTHGHRVDIATSMSCRIVDREAFFAFAMGADGGPDYLQARTNSDAVESYLAEHNEPPPGVEVATVNTVRFTKAKG